MPRATLLSAMLLAAAPAAADERVTSAEAAAALVSGGAERAWIAEPVQAALGSDGCVAGERWRFRTGGVVAQERCQGGAWTRAETTWALSGGGTDLLTMTIGDAASDATLVCRDGELELTLFTLPERKDQETVERRLTYALDGACP